MKQHFVWWFFKSYNDSRAVEYFLGSRLYDLARYAVPDDTLGPDDNRSQAILVRPQTFEGPVPDEPRARAWLEAEEPGITERATAIRALEIELPGRVATFRAPFDPLTLGVPGFVERDTTVTARVVVVEYDDAGA